MPRCRLGDILASNTSGGASQAKVISRRPAPRSACFKSISEGMPIEHLVANWVHSAVHDVRKGMKKRSICSFISRTNGLIRVSTLG